MKTHLTVPQSSETDGGASVPGTGASFGTQRTHVSRTEVRPRRRILLVNADQLALMRLDARLTGEGYVVVPVRTFHAARKRFHAIGPDLVVADVRLEAFNGLHLGWWVRLEHPNVPVIITHSSCDHVLEREAQFFGVKFVTNPLENPEFLRHVRAAIGEPRRAHAMARPR